MSERTYSAKSRTDMQDLAKALLSAPRAARPAMAANLVAEGAMIPRQWWVRFAIWAVKKRTGLDTFRAWAAICARAPQIADDFIEQTADWIARGKDADGEGVGGFNQREVDTVAGMLCVVGSPA